jgi:hypothetical protein
LAIIHERGQGVAKTLSEFFGTLRNEVAKEVNFEAQPKPFDGIEIGAVAWQEMNLEVMPIETLSFMPAGVVDNEQSAFGFQRRDLFGQVIEVILKDIGIDSIKDHRRALSGSRAHCADDVSSDMISKIRQGWSAASHSSANQISTPASACQRRSCSKKAWRCSSFWRSGQGRGTRKL